MTNKAPTSLHLNDFLPYKINILSKKISNSLASIYTAEFGISVPEFRTLVWLHSHPHIYARDLCAYTLMDKTQVSRVIHGLEKLGLLIRQADDHDQRSYQLSLTDAGETLIQEIIPKAVVWEEQLLSALSPRQYQQLQTAVEKLEEQLALLASGIGTIER